MSRFLLTAPLLLLPLTFIPPAESSKLLKTLPPCVRQGFSCVDFKRIRDGPVPVNNVTATIVGLKDPSDCGKQCQLYNRNKGKGDPECTVWTMFHIRRRPTECFLLESCANSQQKRAFTGRQDCPPTTVPTTPPTTVPTTPDTTVPTTPDTTIPTTPCPTGWSESGGNCYKYFDNSVKWDDARKRCLSEEADLASIHSEEENDFLREITGNTRTWVGGRRSCPSCNDFNWSDGTPMDFTAWHPNQPDNGNQAEECMELNWQWDGKGSIGWNDDNCNRTDIGRFVCKKSFKRGLSSLGCLSCITSGGIGGIIAKCVLAGGSPKQIVDCIESKAKEFYPKCLKCACPIVCIVQPELCPICAI